MSTCALTAQCPLSPMQHAACSTTPSTTPSAERTNRGTWDGSRNRNITERAKTCLLGNPLLPEIHSTAAPQDQATTPPVNYTCIRKIPPHCPLWGGSRARLRMAAMGQGLACSRESPGDYPGLELTQTARLDQASMEGYEYSVRPTHHDTSVAASRRRPLFHSLSPGDTWEERNLTTWDGWDKTGESPTYAGAMFVRAAPNWTPALAKRQTNPDSATLGQRPVPTLNLWTLSLAYRYAYPWLAGLDAGHTNKAPTTPYSVPTQALIPYLSQTPLYLDPVGLGQKGSQETARHRILFSRLRLREKNNPESRGKRPASTSSSGPSSIIPAAVAV
ncbi:hypothetical protein JMJ77_0005765 [Colletotrichum scovillei]|uniref:Uncharacterized protein n=1 Tax=Colletotrichum scovillei TaxID=1209932 RepID=A0A9P7UKQ9_9PEZI|nr:hypothetical protein JMJ77_0005765 [Colletotrichum scovillei]KAG7076968.1 hypothetical protein JMJ76_0014224 [Colletotrichum scovillei]KAG7084107.1 hypothetical protein JMJ78_0009547 [Colletotrichum scovillei]